MTKVKKNHQIMSQHSKECWNKVGDLEEETSIAKKENYVMTKDENERTEDCRNKKIYIVTEFKAIESDKLCCNKVFMSRHNTLISQHKLDNCSRIMSRHCKTMSR